MAAVLGAGHLLAHPAATHVILLLIDKARHRVRLPRLASSNARADRLIKIHDSSGTLQRIAAKTVRLVARLVQRATTRLGTAEVGILRIHVLVAASIHGAEALGSSERASTFIVADSYA